MFIKSVPYPTKHCPSKLVTNNNPLYIYVRLVATHTGTRINT